MKKDLALKRYLERHIEPGLPNAPAGLKPWQYVLVIPVYDESPALLQALKQLDGSSRILVIVVLNRPDSNSDPTINSAFRVAIAQLAPTAEPAEHELCIHKIGGSVDLFCYDLEQTKGPSPAAQGVGLARKAGCDIALLWQTQGVISSEWICSSDADARLPADYFSRLDRADNSVAAVFPFAHSPGSSADVNQATALYELKLHQYVAGLSYALSPYAYHSLGSCIAVKRNNYAQVRGYPKRAGGEDFYLLNKLAKLGPIASLSGECIAIASRTSHRVPFGTGPAIEKIMSADKLSIFYHPECFEALRAVLAAAPQFGMCEPGELTPLFLSEGLNRELAIKTAAALNKLGIDKAIKHCRQHGKTEQQFIRQFNQWFDGFKTLKFIHAIRDSGRPMLNLDELAKTQTSAYSSSMNWGAEVAVQQAAIRKQLEWTFTNHTRFGLAE